VTPVEHNALNPSEREGFERIDYDDTFYYSTHYGSPVAYMRAVEIAGVHGIASLNAARILDIGYGAIGGVRMMASAGAQVSAVDIDSLLPALYRDAADQGSVKGIDGRTGSIALFHGVYAGNTTLTKLIGRNFNVIVSKNTMKRGFMKPTASRKAYVSFDASDEVLLDTIYDTLAPGGLLVIYNITGAPDPAKPATDGRSPFSREQFVKANLNVLALDASDDAGVRAMGKALGWHVQMGDLDKNLFASYTVVQRGK
jgi:SAM-dependent methyltransferase